MAFPLTCAGLGDNRVVLSLSLFCVQMCAGLFHTVLILSFT